jgi:TetR/AcrR family transcriptional regulator, tetracycline repressor protein
MKSASPKRTRTKASAASPPGLSRETVARAAIKLVDKVGLDGLTVRRLAEDLGVQNPALYWHFKNKQALLDEMAATLLHDAFGAALQPGPHEPWQGWVRLIGRTFRAAMRGCRDGARVIGSADLSRSDLLVGLDQTVARLVAFGFAPRDALFGVLAVSDYTMGATFEQQADPGASDPASMKAAERRKLYAPYPTLSALIEELATSGKPKPDATFDAGVDLLVEGMAAKLARTKR